MQNKSNPELFSAEKLQIIYELLLKKPKLLSKWKRYDPKPKLNTVNKKDLIEDTAIHTQNKRSEIRFNFEQIKNIAITEKPE